MCYVWADWMIRSTGLGIGRPDADSAYPDACRLVEFFLSGGARGFEYTRELPPDDMVKLIGLAEEHRPDFDHALEEVAHEDAARLAAELHGLTHRGIYDGYMRARSVLKDLLPSSQELHRLAVRGLEVRKKLEFSVTAAPTPPPQTLARPRRVKHESKSTHKGGGRVSHRARASD
jgi:hypothetical protein